MRVTLFGNADLEGVRSEEEIDRQEFLREQKEMAAEGVLPENELVLLEEIQRLNAELDEEEMIFEVERSQLIKEVHRLQKELSMITDVSVSFPPRLLFFTPLLRDIFLIWALFVAESC